MPFIRAEQVLDLTLKDLQVADDAAIQQHKVQGWEDDPAGWISKGIIKPVTTGNLPQWDGSQAGEFYYDINTNELFFGLSIDPYYQIIMGSLEGSGSALSDKILVVQMSIESENWSGADDNDPAGTASKFNLGTDAVAGDGSNLTVYLNGVLQEQGSGADYIIIEEAPLGGGDPVDKVIFNYNLQGPEQKIVAIINADQSLVNYATKAYVDQKFFGDSGHDHDGMDSNQLDFNASMTEQSLGAIIHDIVPNTNAVNLGSPTNKFGNIYAEVGHFDANTIYLGNVALSGDGDILQASLDQGTTYAEVPLSKNDSAPTEIIAGASQPVILESTVGITAKGDILPDMTGATGNISVRNIGSATEWFSSIYTDELFLGASSLYVNNKKVIEDDSDVMTFRTEADQAVNIKTTSSIEGVGNGNLTIESGNEINIMAYGGSEWLIPNTVSSKQMNFTNNSTGGNITFTSAGANSQVQFNATDEIDLTAPVIDVNGDLNVSGSIIGNASTASALQVGRTINLGNDLSGSVVFDGSGDVTLNATVSNDSHTHDNRYYTETEADSMFVSIIGDTMLGNLVAPTFTGVLVGNADTASALETSRTITLSGDVSGSTSFDGSGDVTITTTVADGSHSHDDRYYTETELNSGQLDNRYYTETEADSRFVNISGDTMSGDLTINGNLVVAGTTTTVNSETVNIADNILMLNSNHTGEPIQNSGIEVERGTSINYQFLFDESSDTFKIGEIGSLQKVATREDNPVDNGVPYWNETLDRFDTNSGITISGSNLVGNLTGNASTATTLQTARTISLTGDVTGSTTFDGSGNASITATVGNNSHTHTSDNISDAATSSTPNVIVKRDGGGDISARLFRSEFDFTNGNIGFVMTQMDTGSNNHIRPSTTAQLAAQMESDNVIVKYNGDTRADGQFYTGTTDPISTNRLNYDGYFYATRVYNAIYNDLAEFMYRAEEVEPGRVVIMTENGLAASTKRGEKAVVGVVSDTYGQALGADDQENKLPVGLAGRVDVWVKEPVEFGDLLISDEDGFATVKRASEDGDGRVIGKAMAKKDDFEPSRISMLIMMK